MNIRRGLVAGLAGLILAGSFVSPAQAKHDEPPRGVLKAPHSWQLGEFFAYCWSHRDRGSNRGQSVCVDTFAHSYPEPDVTIAGAEARIRTWAPRRPRQFSIDIWREVDANGQPLGKSERLPFTFEPHRKDGRLVAYDAIFTLPAEPGEAYLTVFSAWNEIERRDGFSDGDAFYDFHLTLE